MKLYSFMDAELILGLNLLKQEGLILRMPKLEDMGLGYTLLLILITLPTATTVTTKMEHSPCLSPRF